MRSGKVERLEKLEGSVGGGGGGGEIIKGKPCKN